MRVAAVYKTLILWTRAVEFLSSSLYHYSFLLEKFFFVSCGVFLHDRVHYSNRKLDGINFLPTREHIRSAGWSTANRRTITKTNVHLFVLSGIHGTSRIKLDRDYVMQHINNVIDLFKICENKMEGCQCKMYA